MSTWELAREDEDRHAIGPEELWGESWYHDFAAADGSYGGYTRLGLYPNRGVAWFWLHLVRPGRPLVVVRDHTVPCPAFHTPLDVRTDTLRSSWRTMEPLRTYRVTAEAQGVALADPADALRGERGDPVRVRVDLEWFTAAAPFPYSATTRFEISTRVRGEMVIDDERVEVDCPGQRDHSWGVRDWWSFPWLWSAGRLDDGTWFHGVRTMIPGMDAFQTGYVVDPDGTQRATDRVLLHEELDAEKLLVSAAIRIGDLELAATPELQAPVLLVADDGRESRFWRALTRFETPDGRTGRGWTELNWPPGFPA